MAEKRVKIASLNLWQFNDWEQRVRDIIDLVKKVDPDILLTQETQIDPNFDDRNQIEILNEKLCYPYFLFQPAEVRTQKKGVKLPFPVSHGLGVLSKFPLEFEVLRLTRASDDKENRIILVCSANIEGLYMNFANVHFSNSNLWAEDHFKETLAVLDERNIQPILVGDFNIYNIEKYKDIYGDKYISSSEKFEYISYPDDGASLDYFLIPKNCEFLNFKCQNEYVSDHRMIVAEILLK